MISLFFNLLIACILSIVETSEINIAFGKLAWCSSRSTPFYEYLTLDGNLEGNSYFASASGGFQWLMVELFWRYQVNNVVVTKQDSNFDDMFVAVDDGVFPKPQNVESLKNICKREPANLNPNTTAYNCASSICNFVLVLQNGNAMQPLVLYEVEVYGIWAEKYPEMPNVLLNKDIRASAAIASVYLQYLVNGIRFPFYCNEINEGKYGNNWFKVDMGTPYYIDYVAYAIRQSSFASSRSNKFMVGFSESDFTSLIRGNYPLCGQYQGTVPEGSRVTMKCNANLPAYRYFIIQQPYGTADGYFGACELEAYPASSTVGNMWKNKGAMLLTNYTISMLQGSRSADCVFYCFKLGFHECDSFNFNLKMKKCQLNKHRNGFPSQNLIPHTDWSFYASEYIFSG